MTECDAPAMTGQDFIASCQRRKADLGPNRSQRTVPMLPIELPRLPDNWWWASLSEVCERVSVGHVGPTTEHFCSEQEGVPFVRSQDVRPGKLHLMGSLTSHRTFTESYESRP